MNISLKKSIQKLLVFTLVLIFTSVRAQTLQSVTNNGNTTTNNITIGTGHNGAKLNVNAIGINANGSTDVSMILANQNYSSANSAGENRLVFGWANHWAAALSAYKDDANITGLKFITEWGFNTPVERMRILGNGNVGIGTTNPTEKLSVNGKIRAKEIKVETGWADFVFAKDYKLPSLSDTEKHIKEKGHLPGIPSAAEVAKDGIELGDMNKKLLQKIEELTLYLIEQSKEVKSLKKDIEDIKTSKNKL